MIHKIFDEELLEVSLLAFLLPNYFQDMLLLDFLEIIRLFLAATSINWLILIKTNKYSFHIDL